MYHEDMYCYSARPSSPNLCTSEVERGANELCSWSDHIIAPPLLVARIEQRNERYASKPNAFRMHYKLSCIVGYRHRIELFNQLVKAVEYVV
jgi:hypothetical protein